jgi:hypothetical protein
MARPKQGVPKDKVAEILKWLSEGKPLREWCRIKGNPSYGTVYDWKDKDSEFSSRFAHARDIGYELLAQECLKIADTPKRGRVVTKDGKGAIVEVKFQDMTDHRKLQIDTRLKLLARWDPSRYAERLNTVHSGKLTLEELVCGDDDRRAE